MCVVFKTKDPSKLVAALKRDIRDGTIETWEIDSDGDLRHTPGSWRSKGWIKVHVNSDNVTLGVKIFPDVENKREVFGVLSGRVVEPFVSHLYGLFDLCTVGQNPSSVDSDLK